MSLQIASRDRRVSWMLTGTVLAVAAVVTGLSIYWAQFMQWSLSTQIILHRYLVLSLLKINAHQYLGGIWLLSGAFIYGVLHAIGPGHGKFIVTTYLSTNKESLLAARVIPFLGSLLQGASAILFVFILAIGFNMASGDLSLSRWYIEKISAVFIGSFGVFVILQAIRRLLPAHPRFTAFRPQNNHVDDDQCQCGGHGVANVAALAQADWKTRCGVVLAIGARPCSGAIMVLLFSNALGMVTWGVMAVMTMALGTALSILGLSLAVRYARNRTVTLFIGQTSPSWLVPAVKILGGILLVLFAMVLFVTVIPVSPNGDYIAAGC